MATHIVNKLKPYLQKIVEATDLEVAHREARLALVLLNKEGTQK